MEVKERNAMRRILHRFRNRVSTYLKAVNHPSYLQHDVAKWGL